MVALVPAHLLTAVPPINRGVWLPGQHASALQDVLRYAGLWWLLFAVTAFALMRAPRRPAVITALVLGVAVGAVSLVHTAVLSDDLYRYVWDGRVMAAGINPYRYAPNDPHLAFLHDRWLWPTDAECAARGKIVHPGTAPCIRINRPGMRTIYPPVAQLWFLLQHAVIPSAARDLGWEVAGLVLATATGVLLAWLLHRTGRDPRWVVLWACSPVVALEAVQSAHVDSLAALLVAAGTAVLLTAQGFPDALGRGRTAAAAALVATAGLVKLYPFVLLPGLFQRRRPTAWLTATAVMVVGYAPFTRDIGGGVLGSLSSYLHQEGYGKGTRFQLLALTGLSGTPVKVLAYLIVAAVLVLALLRRLGEPLTATLTVFLTLLLVATPGEPWYELVLLVLIVLTGRWEWCLFIVADYATYLNAMFGGPGKSLPHGLYIAALVLGLGVTLLRRRRDGGEVPPWRFPGRVAAADTPH
jgi:hypothetical protein